MESNDQVAFDRAWRHFQLHAEQRIAVFNFFVASSGLLLTGLAYVLSGVARLWLFGVAAGALVSLLAFVFWKLDQRSGQLIQVSEGEIERIEQSSAAGRGVFTVVAALPTAPSIADVKGVWTFGRSFRLLFLAIGALGLAGSVMSVWRGLGPGSSLTNPCGAASPSPKPQPAPTMAVTDRPPYPALSRRPGAMATPATPLRQAILHSALAQ